MNLRSALAGLLLIVSGTQVAYAAPEGFRQLSPGSVEQQTYERSRVLAESLVREAAPRLDAVNSRLGRGVLSALQQASFAASSDGRSRQLCAAHQYSLFVHSRSRNRIFICDEVRPHARVGDRDAVERLAQGFVHEAVHLTGQMDECAAMRFELAVMQQTIGVKSQGSQIRYGAGCRGRAAIGRTR